MSDPIMTPLETRKPTEIVREQVRKLEECLRENGVKLEKPVLTVDTLGTPSIPHLRITHQGYLSVEDGKILPVEL
jgi:adenine deaminase